MRVIRTQAELIEAFGGPITQEEIDRSWERNKHVLAQILGPQESEMIWCIRADTGELVGEEKENGEGQHQG